MVRRSLGRGRTAQPQARARFSGARAMARRSKPAASRSSYLGRRRAQRDRDDESLVEAMRMAPGASIGDWAAAIGKSRSSTVSGLHRLRDAGLAESAEGKWRLTEPEAPMTPPPKWVAPVRGTDRAHQHHLTQAWLVSSGRRTGNDQDRRHPSRLRRHRFRSAASAVRTAPP